MSIVVIGGGAAGMMAAIAASQSGKKVLLVEKNEKLGKKIFITGKGRCNVTNNCSEEDFFSSVVTNSKFLMSAIYNYPPTAVMAFFEQNGVRLKTERGNRVFPESDKSSDIIKALTHSLSKHKVEVFLDTNVTDITGEAGNFLVKTDRGIFNAEKVVIATGGVTYKATGSDGFGLKLAEKLGHKIVNPKAALVGVRTNVYSDLAGLALKNVEVSLVKNDKKVQSQFGEMLFTHTGVSGPTVLSLSSFATKIDEKSKVSLSIDLKPALSKEQLNDRILRDFKEFSNRDFVNSLSLLLPKSLIGAVVEKSKIPPLTKVHQITAVQRMQLVAVLKDFSLPYAGLEDIDGAIITSGGVSVSQINPSTMQSKIKEGVYFCGEMIDVDALTGGFNLQIAFSSGRLAGESC